MSFRQSAMRASRLVDTRIYLFIVTRMYIDRQTDIYIYLHTHTYKYNVLRRWWSMSSKRSAMRASRLIDIHLFIFIYIFICIYIYIAIPIHTHIYIYNFILLYTRWCLMSLRQSAMKASRLDIYIYSFLFTYFDLFRYICIYLYMHPYIYNLLLLYTRWWSTLSRQSAMRASRPAPPEVASGTAARIPRGRTC